jgi:hypothetical protein
VHSSAALAFPDPQPALTRRVAEDKSPASERAFHRFSPSQRIETYAETTGMPCPSNGRNSSALTNCREQTREVLQQSFKLHVTEPSKVAARKLGKSAETVDAYRQVGLPKSWADMIECGRKYPAFALDVVEMMGLDIDRDRDSYAIFLSLQRAVRER